MKKLLALAMAIGCGDNLVTEPEPDAAVTPACASLQCLSLACSTSSEGPGNCSCEIEPSVYMRCVR